ncbi:MAG TPA: MAPEG family protein [Arenimonas sp.]|nr:MAPEG family protein [Arenimonas sp.]
MDRAFVLPVFAMVLLNLLVWLRLYQTRIGEMKRRRIHPQAVASSSQMAALEDTRAADNFRNLFELPVLFYAAMLLIIFSQTESLVLLVLAWAFVALRYLHSYIHCTYNRVKDRFTVYLFSGAALWAMWAVMAYAWLR